MAVSGKEAREGAHSDDLQERYRSVRAWTELICRPLEVEDYVLQSTEDVSPPKWHLAHTAWFFETFVLTPFKEGYEAYHPMYGYLFNSYYEQAGPHHGRPHRGQLSRPTVKEIYAYRKHVDAHMEEFLERSRSGAPTPWLPVLETGLNHEQQHQELLLYDIHYNLSVNPLRPAYTEQKKHPAATGGKEGWAELEGGLKQVGHSGEGFSFDNERPAHKVWLEPFRLSHGLVTNRAYLAFVEEGGYRDPRFWLSDGWDCVQRYGWRAPLYWEKIDDRWWVFTLSGLKPLDEDAPVCHVSHYEADAFARWAHKRLPTEHEWEVAFAPVGPGEDDNFLEDGFLRPVPPRGTQTLSGGFGDVWEWTQSAYLPYPGYVAPQGTLGEYNGKFMSGQMVLRGGSALTPKNHIRATYRNFFRPEKRWPLTGFRLAEGGVG